MFLKKLSQLCSFIFVCLIVLEKPLDILSADWMGAAVDLTQRSWEGLRTPFFLFLSPGKSSVWPQRQHCPCLAFCSRNSCFLLPLPQEAAGRAARSDANKLLPLRLLISFSCVWRSAIPWTAVCQTLSMGFSRQEHWSGLPCPPPGDLPDRGSNPGLLQCRQMLLPLSHQGGPANKLILA